MKTESGYDYTNTYYNDNGEYHEFNKQLQELIPSYGEASTDALNLYRTASNLYYDLYNNGLCNKEIRLPEFKKACANFRPQICELLTDKKSLNQVLNGRKNYEAYEDVMNAIILFVMSENSKETENESVSDNQERDFVLTALNAYWNDTYSSLQKKGLGDIKEKELKKTLEYSSKLMIDIESGNIIIKKSEKK